MNVLLGVGLAGLSAGHVLHGSGEGLVIVKKCPAVGGLTRTVQSGDFRFDPGGHRFIAKDRGVADFVNEVLDDHFLDVGR